MHMLDAVREVDDVASIGLEAGWQLDSLDDLPPARRLSC